MFPFDLDENDEIQLEESQVTETEPVDEYEIDFETMTLTGRMISGIDALKQRIKIALGVPRYEFTQYSWEFGADFSQLIGKTYTVKKLTPIVDRMVREALSDMDDIESINSVTLDIIRDKVTVYIDISTIYGNDTIETELEI